MAVKLVSFTYENIRYFVCLDGGFLQGNFEGKNAVPIGDIMGNAGYAAAVAQSWGKASAISCPISTDAEVSKTGDKFKAKGTCGNFKFELDEDNYVCEPIEEEKKVEKPAETQPALSEDEVKDLLDVTSSVVESSKREEKRIGSYKKSSIRINGSIKEYDREPKSVIIVNEVRESSKFRGIKRMPKKQQGEIRMNQRNNPMSEQVLKTAAEETKPVPVRESVKPKHIEEPVRREEDERGFTPPKRKESEAKPTELFSTAPKITFDNFDTDEFLNKLEGEQRAFLEQVPDGLLGAITNFTRKPVSMDKLKSLGAVYCVQNKWAICGDWYAIDDVAQLARVIYCATTNKGYSVPTKTIKGWVKCKELGLVG